MSTKKLHKYNLLEKMGKHNQHAEKKKFSVEKYFIGKNYSGEFTYLQFSKISTAYSEYGVSR